MVIYVCVWGVCGFIFIVEQQNEYQFILDYDQAIGLMDCVFANGPGDQGSIPGWIILKT